MKLLLLFSSLLVISCTDTDRSSLSAFGSKGTIKCYSGTILIYSGESTGRIQTVSHSDGWEFKDAKTGKFVRISGACVIQN